MYTTQLAEEPPTHTDTICIGVALVGENIQVAARATGREIAHGSFPASPLGTSALLSYLADWQTPARKVRQAPRPGAYPRCAARS